jgi:hypothetical protein
MSHVHGGLNCLRERTSSIWECGTWGFTPCGCSVVRLTGAVVSMVVMGLWQRSVSMTEMCGVIGATLTF